jgi:hypothetical protein
MGHIIKEHSDGLALVAIANEVTADKLPTARGRADRYPDTVRAVLHGQDATVLAGGVA